MKSAYGRPQYNENLSTQACLMKTRGDLSKTSFSFNASLPAPGSIAQVKGLGMDLVPADHTIGEAASLIVAGVDNNARQGTPVAEWNSKEDRQANRCAEEQRASFAIRPGDKICAVNGTHGDYMAMADMLAEAANPQSSPKPIRLTLERTRSDVLGPQDTHLMLPPRPPTSGTGDKRPYRFRRNSNPDTQHLPPCPTSGEGEAAMSTALRRKSEPDARRAYSLQWSSMLSAGPLSDFRGRCWHKKISDDECSTRSSSASGSRRSPSVSTTDSGPPLVIRCNKTSQALARVGLATLAR